MTEQTHNQEHYTPEYKDGILKHWCVQEGMTEEEANATFSQIFDETTPLEWVLDYVRQEFDEEYHKDLEQLIILNEELEKGYISEEFHTSQVEWLAQKHYSFNSKMARVDEEY